jgi:hypothetical protein
VAALFRPRKRGNAPGAFIGGSVSIRGYFLRSLRSSASAKPMARQVFAGILFPYRADIPSGHSIRHPQVQKRSGFYGGNDRYLGFRHWRYERDLQRG